MTDTTHKNHITYALRNQFKIIISKVSIFYTFCLYSTFTIINQYENPIYNYKIYANDSLIVNHFITCYLRYQKQLVELELHN